MALTESAAKSASLEQQLQQLREEKDEVDEYLSEFEAASLAEADAAEAAKSEMEAKVAKLTAEVEKVRKQKRASAKLAAEAMEKANTMMATLAEQGDSATQAMQDRVVELEEQLSSSHEDLARFEQLKTVADGAGYTIDELLEGIPELTSARVEKEDYKKKLKAMSNKADMYKKQLAERDAQMVFLRSTAAGEDESDEEDSLPFDHSHLLSGPTHSHSMKENQSKKMKENQSFVIREQEKYLDIYCSLITKMTSLIS